jgi:uncharacterized membrane protein
MSFAVLLSLGSAVAYGLSDFVGGILSRRASAWAVATMSQGTAAVLTVALVTTNVGDFTTATLLWGILAGIGSGAGNVLIYRGLAAGRMTVVAPVSATAAAALPVLAGTVTGERPGILPMIGVLTALPAIWLVSGGRRLQDIGRVDMVNGLSAGAGFGLQFSALGQIPREAGLMPLAVSQVASVFAIVGAAVMFSAHSVPRDRSSRLGAVAGLLAGTATLCFQLAVLVLRERVHGAQGLGLALAATAVALIASG